MKVKSESEVSQSCLTLSNLMDCSLPGSSVHGIFQARVLLEWGAIALSVSEISQSQKINYYVISHTRILKKKAETVGGLVMSSSL